MNFRKWITRLYSKVGKDGIFMRAECVDRPDLGGTLITLDIEVDTDPELTDLFGEEE